MNDITIFPADIAEMSVSQLAALPPAQKHEIDKNLDAAIDWLKKARTKFDAALDQCYGEQARTALRESGRDFGTAHISDGPLHLKFELPKPLLERDESASATSSPLDSTHDLARTAFFQINNRWTDGTKRAVRHAMSFARRYAEQGDYEVSGAALSAVVGINAAYIDSKGKTFYANNSFVDNPFSSDSFINDTLEHLRQNLQVGIARRDEQQIEQTLQAMEALVRVYLGIDYSSPHASKSHAQLAAGYQRCGLKAPPLLVRMRVLNQALRARVGGVGDITAPVEDLAGLNLPVSHVFIVENLQTGLAMSDMPGAVVFMRLGYNVDVLARFPWLARAKCIYWGDLDTHGFAILHRARSYIPALQSVLMDEDTLLQHKTLWVDESAQHPATELPLLTEQEQQLYRDLKQQRWGQNVRLEQERIDWATAWGALQRLAVRT